MSLCNSLAADAAKPGERAHQVSSRIGGDVGSAGLYPKRYAEIDALGWARLGAPGGIAGWVAVLWGLTAMVYAGSALRRRRAGVSG